jgi:hypothetical protein
VRLRTRLQKGSRAWTRTRDPAINSRLLYQLSYSGIYGRARLAAWLATSSAIRVGAEWGLGGDIAGVFGYFCAPAGLVARGR